MLPSPSRRSTSCWRPKASATPSGCRPIRSCKSGSATSQAPGRPTAQEADRVLRQLPLPGQGLDQGAPGGGQGHQGELYPRVGFIVTNLARPSGWSSFTTAAAWPSSTSRSYEGGRRPPVAGRGPNHPSRRRPMPTNHHLVQSDTAIRSDVASIFVSLELSRSRWLVTSLSPGREKMSKHSVTGGDGAGLLDLLTRLRDKAEQRARTPVRIVLIQEAGLDGFWIHRLLVAHGIESHVVNPLRSQARRASWEIPNSQAQLWRASIAGHNLCIICPNAAQ